MAANPKKAEWVSHLAWILRRQEHFEEAEQASRRAAEIDPAYSTQLVGILITEKKLDEAESTARRYLATQPDSLGIRGSLVETLKAKRQWNDALQEIRTGWAEASSHDREVQLSLLSYEAEKDQADEAAMSALREALALEVKLEKEAPESRTVGGLDLDSVGLGYDRLARLLEKHEQWSELIQTLYAAELHQMDYQKKRPGRFLLPRQATLRSFAERSMKAGRKKVAVDAYVRAMELPVDTPYGSPYNSFWLEPIFDQLLAGGPDPDAVQNCVKLLSATKATAWDWQKTISKLIAARRYSEANKVVEASLNVRFDGFFRPSIGKLVKDLAEAGAVDEAKSAMERLSDQERRWAAVSLGQAFEKSRRLADAAKAYAQSGGFLSNDWKDFLKRLRDKDGVDAVWDAHRAVYEGAILHKSVFDNENKLLWWQRPKDTLLNEPDVSDAELARAAYEGRVIVTHMGPGYFTLRGTDCKNYLDAPRVTYGEPIVIADSEPQHPASCPEKSFLVVKHQGRNLLLDMKTPTT